MNVHVMLKTYNLMCVSVSRFPCCCFYLSSPLVLSSVIPPVAVTTASGDRHLRVMSGGPDADCS